MKKLLLGAGVAMSMLLASCGGSSNQSMNNFTDSVSTIFGEYQGSYLNEMYQQIPEGQRAMFAKADILRGLKEALLADTATAEGYYAGLNMGSQLASQILQMERNGVKVDRTRLLQALSQGFLADTVNNSPELQAQYSAVMGRVQQIVMESQNEAMAAQREAQAAANAETLKAGEDYIAKLKAEDPEIKTTASGLSYKVVKQGTGATPSADSPVKLTYTGRLIDGTEFDSSKGETVEFVPSQTVPGFSEGLQLMNPGSEYILYIPASLGYGDRAVGNIPANSMLVFDVKVVGVE